MAMTQDRMQAMLESVARAIAEQQRMVNDQHRGPMQAFVAQFAGAFQNVAGGRVRHGGPGHVSGGVDAKCLFWSSDRSMARRARVEEVVDEVQVSSSRVPSGLAEDHGMRGERGRRDHGQLERRDTFSGGSPSGGIVVQPPLGTSNAKHGRSCSRLRMASEAGGYWHEGTSPMPGIQWMTTS